MSKKKLGISHPWKLIFLLTILSIVIFAGLRYINKSNDEVDFYGNFPKEFEYLRNKKDLLLEAPKSKITFSKRNSATSIPVLYYHGISEYGSDEEVSWVNFKNQLFLLKKEGYETITLDQLKDFLSGKISLPKRSFLLTFDDGRKDSYYPADPVLKTLDYSAVMFVITSKTDNDDFFLTTNELVKMLSSGRWEIQSHGGLVHSFGPTSSDDKQGRFLSNKLWKLKERRLETDGEYISRIRKDIAQSKNDLEKNFGIDVSAFAIPFSDYGQQETNYPDSESIILAEIKSVYDYAFYQPWGGWHLFNYPGVDNFMIRRIGVESDWNANELVDTLSSFEDKNIDYANLFDHDNNWYASNGNVEMVDDELIISSNRDKDSGSALLAGSMLWDNYEFSVLVKLKNEDNLSLLSRVNESGDYISCNFGAQEVTLSERVGGTREVIGKRLENLGFILKTPTEFGIKVNKKNVECSVEGVVKVKNQTLKHKDPNGTVGISVWNPIPGQAGLVVKSVRTKGLDEN